MGLLQWACYNGPVTRRVRGGGSPLTIKLPSMKFTNVNNTQILSVYLYQYTLSIIRK